jgi:hypothetical protein
MRPFSKKSISKQAEVPERPRFLYDREPYDQAEQRGAKEIDKHDPEYTFLVKLVKLLTAEGVPPQEIKSIADAYPFVTVDDVGDLAAKLWTLATEKYNIPREFLLSKLPKNASLKIASDDLWPAQEDADDMLNHAPGYLAYEYGQDKTADGEFTGAEFSTDDVGVNPTLDSGPFSSPEDQGAKPQKSPFPNTGWLPADDENKDEQPASNVASAFKRPFSKKARMDAPAWIDPSGKIFTFSDNTHDTWGEANAEMLKTQYNLDLSQMDPNTDSTVSYMIDNGWTRAAVADSAIVFNTKDIGRVDQLDDYVAQNWQPGFQYVLIETFSGNWVVNDPFPTLRKGIQKSKRMGKQADLSGQIVNQVLNSIHANSGATFNLSQGNMVGTDNYAVSIYPERSEILPSGTDFDTLEQFMLKNEDLLNNAENSIGAWVNGGKLYLDIVATIPDEAQAIELGKQHNQIAIWDLKNGKEIQTGGTGEVKKTADDQVLPQDQQDQIAATTAPIYNTALNNYAQAVKRGHEKDRALEYAIQSVSNMEKIDPKKLVELINNYL